MNILLHHRKDLIRVLYGPATPFEEDLSSTPENYKKTMKNRILLEAKAKIDSTPVESIHIRFESAPTINSTHLESTIVSRRSPSDFTLVRFDNLIFGIIFKKKIHWLLPNPAFSTVFQESKVGDCFRTDKEKGKCEYFSFQETSNLLKCLDQCSDEDINRLCLYPPPVVEPLSLDEQPLDGLNATQTVVLRKFLAMDQGILLCQGPPGTGKTTLTARIVDEFFKKSEPILVTAEKNKGLQCIARGLLKIKVSEFIVFGSKEKFDRDLHKYFGQKSQYEESLIVLSTISSCSRFLGKGKQFSALIIDEAGQAAETKCLIPYSLHSKKVLLVGDPKQLPPYSDRTDVPTSIPLSMMTRLAAMNNNNSRIMLDKNYRCRELIYAFPNKQFYAEGVESLAAPRENAILFPMGPICFISMPGTAETVLSSKSKINYSQAEFVVKVIKYICERDPSAVDEIYVITPYLGQKTVIENKLRNSKIEILKNIPVLTVDSAQGSEKRFVIYCTVHPSEFSGDPRRVNVALTRAKEMLIVIGNDELLQRIDVWNAFFKSLNRPMMLKSNYFYDQPLLEKWSNSMDSKDLMDLKTLSKKYSSCHYDYEYVTSFVSHFFGDTLKIKDNASFRQMLTLFFNDPSQLLNQVNPFQEQFSDLHPSIGILDCILATHTNDKSVRREAISKFKEFKSRFPFKQQQQRDDIDGFVAFFEHRLGVKPEDIQIMQRHKQNYQSNSPRFLYYRGCLHKTRYDIDRANKDFRRIVSLYENNKKKYLNAMYIDDIYNAHCSLEDFTGAEKFANECKLGKSWHLEGKAIKCYKKKQFQVAYNLSREALMRNPYCLEAHKIFVHCPV